MFISDLKKHGILAAPKNLRELMTLRDTLYKVGQSTLAGNAFQLAGGVSHNSGGRAVLEGIYFGDDVAVYGGVQYQAVVVLMDKLDNYLLIYCPLSGDRHNYMVLAVNNPSSDWTELAVSTFATTVSTLCNCL